MQIAFLWNFFNNSIFHNVVRRSHNQFVQLFLLFNSFCFFISQYFICFYFILCSTLFQLYLIFFPNVFMTSCPFHITAYFFRQANVSLYSAVCICYIIIFLGTLLSISVRIFMFLKPSFHPFTISFEKKNPHPTYFIFATIAFLLLHFSYGFC